VSAPFGSRDAELPFVHIHVFPFEPDHLAASKTGFAAQQNNQGLWIDGRRDSEAFELLKVVEPCFRSRRLHQLDRGICSITCHSTAVRISTFSTVSTLFTVFGDRALSAALRAARLQS